MSQPRMTPKHFNRVVETHEWLDGKPEIRNNHFTSDLLWHAMRDLGMNNWSDDTNFAEVEAAMREIAAEVDPGADVEGYALRYAKENWATYQRLRMFGIVKDGGESGGPGDTDEGWALMRADRQQQGHGRVF